MFPPHLHVHESQPHILYPGIGAEDAASSHDEEQAYAMEGELAQTAALGVSFLSPPYCPRQTLFVLTCLFDGIKIEKSVALFFSGSIKERDAFALNTSILAALELGFSFLFSLSLWMKLARPMLDSGVKGALKMLVGEE